MKLAKLFSTNVGILLAFTLLLASLQFAYNKLLLPDSLFYDLYSQQVSTERIAKFLSFRNKWAWLNYVLLPVFYSLKFLCLTAILYAGAFFLGLDVTMKQLFRWVVLADVVFVGVLLFKILWFSFVQPTYTLDELQAFYPLSALHFFDVKKIDAYLLYPLQLINIFELFYWFALAYAISQVAKTDLAQGMKVVLSSYVPALLLWVVVVMFISLNLS